MSKLPSNFLLDAAPHDEASEWISDKPIVSREVFDGLLPELRAKAFVVAGIEAHDTLLEIKQTLADLPVGKSWAETREQLAELVSPFIAKDSPPNAAEAKAQLLMRTHGFQAYAVASEKVFQSQIETFPFWQYLSLADGHVRHTHAALHGIVAPAKSSFWRDHTPPWEWACRCRKVALLPEEVDELKAEEADKEPENQKVMEGANLKLLEQGRLNRGPSQQIDIRSAIQKGREDGFHFDPSSLIQPLHELQKRYVDQGPDGADTWNAFAHWSKQTEVTDGVTVWHWLNGVVPPDSGPTAPVVEKQTGRLTVSGIENDGLAALQKAGGKGAVQYAGAILDAAQTINAALKTHLAEFPALAPDLAFYGSHRGQIAWVRMSFRDAARQWAESWVIRPQGGANEDYNREVERQMERYFRRKVKTVPKAIAWFQPRSDGNRLVFNAKGIASDYSTEARKSHDSGWFPKTTPAGKELEHVATHEIGHALDELLGLRSHAELRALYGSHLVSANKAEAVERLSIYGTTNVQEMIAEGWAEFRLAPSPRPLAQRIGEIVLAAYQTHFPTTL